MTRVSVLMTTYNSEQFVERALIGLLEQTYEDFEVVIVDDGSQDATVRILESYAKRDVRIRPVFSTHVGRAVALNIGVSHCRGQFIAINDSDDVSCPGRLAAQAAFLAQNEGAVLVAGWAAVVDASGEIVAERRAPESDSQLRMLLALGNPFVHSSVMYRRSSIVQAGGFRQGLKAGIDYDLIERLAQYGELACLQEIVVTHYRGPEQFFRAKLDVATRWRTAATISFRAALHHAPWFLPFSLCMVGLAYLPGIARVAPALQRLHSRIVGGERR